MAVVLKYLHNFQNRIDSTICFRIIKGKTDMGNELTYYKSNKCQNHQLNRMSISNLIMRSLKLSVKDSKPTIKFLIISTLITSAQAIPVPFQTSIEVL
jgi:hypothetical protein